jgi:starch phosphorylase
MTGLGDDDVAEAAQALASRLPEPLGVLARLAFDYSWSWTPGGPEVFQAIDAYRWAMRRENPVRLLLEAPAASLARAASDDGLIARAHALQAELQAERDRPTAEGSADRPVAFFCAEYGVHRSLPTYSGGLGVLAGDILKEASDRAFPLVGVGIMYRQGNFHQNIDRAGWQHEYWIESDPDRLPAALVTGEDGRPLTVSAPLRGRDVVVQIWRVDVGRTHLYLLDAQRPENSRVDRWITARLYVGDRKLRLSQYALLGVAGVRALRALGIDPSVIHLNEGHASLAPLELAREELVRGVPFEQALAAARERTVFTTHTPVAAGNEAYSREEIRDVLGDFPEVFGDGEERLLALGRVHPDDRDEPFGLTPIGLRVSRSANAVSRVHGEVSRAMWQGLFQGRPVDEVPIGHVTNGVHLPTWMAPEMQILLDRYLEVGWRQRTSDPSTWEALGEVPDEELWAVRSELRAGLVDYVRDRSVGDRLARGEPIEYAEAAAQFFDPWALTIGFARRVASYKRLSLLTVDPERALKLLDSPDTVQLVLAGKAHPQDEEAKAVLRAVFGVKWARSVAERVAYLEDYDMGMAAQLVSGCDVWVNLPRPPLEASGTSGMKSAMNGGLNLSVLDGWWEEAFDGTNGWGIESDPSLDPGEQDAEDSATLFDLLEKEVIPLFYDRDEGGIPRGWIQRVRASLVTAGSRFSATRMMDEYIADVYRQH